MTLQLRDLVQQLRSTALGRDDAGLTDGQLLVRFIDHRDQAAVSALVRRHGSMVWGVCQRILGGHHDAEDAFQATFLVLLRKAHSIRQKDAVGNWLYGVALQTARKARAMLAKRRTRESQGMDVPEPQIADPSPRYDVQAVLDEELSRLPDRYRAAIVLCDLEGKRYKEAARQLRCPEGTLATRLARGRTILARRLAARGLAVASGAVAAHLMQNALSAAVPASTVSATIRTLTLVAAGRGLANSAISANVAALTEGVLKAMLLKKLQITTVVLLLVFAGLSAGSLVLETQAADPPAKSETRPAKQDNGRPLVANDSSRTDQEVPSKTGRDVVSAFEHNRARVEEDYLNKKMIVTGKMYRVDRVSGVGFLKETDDQYYFLTLAPEPKDGKMPQYGVPQRTEPENAKKGNDPARQPTDPLNPKKAGAGELPRLPTDLPTQPENVTKSEEPARWGTELPMAFIFPASARKQLAELERGQQVTIEGTCEGKKGQLGNYMGHYVIFTSCKFVKSNLTPATGKK
jgi:RNA polymerase sigma factor (sigma-70 family)